MVIMSTYCKNFEWLEPKIEEDDDYFDISRGNFEQQKSEDHYKLSADALEINIEIDHDEKYGNEFQSKDVKTSLDSSLSNEESGEQQSTSALHIKRKLQNESIVIDHTSGSLSIDQNKKQCIIEGYHDMINPNSPSNVPDT